MKFILFIYLLLLTGHLIAQSPEMPEASREGLSSWCRKEIQEKVYLHTDKSHYIAGEHVWLRAYRTDASTHIPSVYSRFVYVELYDAMDRFESRIKLMERDGVFSGSFPLDPHLPSGHYTLRAYTYWMQNFDDAFYFQKEIVIENREPDKVHHEVVWDTTTNGDWLMSVRFLSGRGEPFSKLLVESRQYNGQREVNRAVTRVNDAGRMQMQLRRKDKVTAVRLKFLDNQPFEYRWILNVPVCPSPSATNIRFFPEGGNLLAGVTSRVGFKAVGTDGLGVNISGEVFRDDGTAVAQFVALHRGMGYFNLKPEAGRSYYAEIVLPEGETRRVELPVVREEGAILRMEAANGMMRWDCLSTSDYLQNRSMYLLLHCRGKILSVLPVEAGDGGNIPLSALPSGILHGVLLDAEGEVYSSRLSFVFPPEKESVHLTTDRKQYGKRDSVFLTLSWQGTDSLSCSVSVTDPALDGEKRWSNDIASYFLLDSDLKGHVEDAGWYFDTTIPQQHRHRMAELLLLTQGWQRFEVGKGAQQPLSLPFFLELTQGFSGQIKNFWGKPAKMARLFAIVPRLRLIKAIPLDTNSRFEFCVEYPDSTEFTFQSYTRSGRKWTELKFKHDSLRELQAPLMSRKGWTYQEEDTLDNIFREVKTLGFDYVNGEKIYRLEEAVVTKPTYGPEGKPLKVLTARDLKEEHFRCALNLVAAVPGVHIENIGGCKAAFYGHSDAIRPRRVAITLEGIPDNTDGFGLSILDLLENIPIKYVDRLEYGNTPDDSIMNIFIYLKKGTDFTLRGLDFYRFTPLGYHKPAEFYIPRYDVAKEREVPLPDKRPTLYWNPDVRLFQGNTNTLRFYTTDQKGPFKVKLEGISPTGEIIHSTLNIESQ